MPAYDSKRATKKQIANVAANVDSYQAKMRENTIHPGQQAIKKKNKMKTNFLEALKDGGKFDEGCMSYTLQEFNERAATVGARNLPQGVQDAESKINAFHDQMSQFMDQHLAKINAMPDDTLEQRLQKQRENAMGMMAFKRNRRR